MITTAAATADLAPTKMTARVRATVTTMVVAGGPRGGEAARDQQQGPQGGLEQLDEERGERRREGGCRAGAAGRGHDGDHDKERSTVQRLEIIIKCINCSR